MKMSLYLIGLLVFLLMFSNCSGDREYEKYQGLENLSWGLQDTLSFQMEKPLPVGPSILIIKYNNDYPFRNLYVKYLLKDSLEQILESQLINIPLFENTTGKPLGKGYGSHFTRYDTMPLNSKIPYSKIQLIQYMRLEELTGIEAVGLKRIKN